jgi:uncharacterized membrane protein
MGLPALVTTLLPTVIFFASYFAGIYAEVGERVYPGPAVVAVIAWVLLERVAHRRFMDSFNAQAVERAEAILKARYTLWKLRGPAFLLSGILLTSTTFLPLF